MSEDLFLPQWALQVLRAKLSNSTVDMKQFKAVFPPTIAHQKLNNWAESSKELFPKDMEAKLWCLSLNSEI